MGVWGMSKCEVQHVCSSPQVVTKIKEVFKKLPNPNPKNFKITRCETGRTHCVVMVRYPDCKNYEGLKVLLMPINFEEVYKLKELDPHFCEGDHPSPIARFEPTDKGWMMAVTMMRMIEN